MKGCFPVNGRGGPPVVVCLEPARISGNACNFVVSRQNSELFCGVTQQ